MTSLASLRRILLAIAGITVLSGFTQLLWPDLVLSVVGGTYTPAAAHFFGIVGMFMVLFGGLLWEGLGPRTLGPAALRWAGFQKLGAAAAVGLGVARDLFGPLALGVAAFDLLSGVLIFYYLMRAR